MDIYMEKNPWDREKDISYLCLYHLEDDRVEELARFDYLIEAPNYTPDGKGLVYNSGGLLYLYDIAQGKSSKIPTGKIDKCNNDHVLSPDGRLVAMSASAGEDGKSRIYIGSLKGGSEPRLVTPQGPSYLHGWSPDGSTLAYCAEREGEFDIYTIPAQGGPEKQLTTAPGLNDGSEYSPDGRHIWFNSVRSGLMQAWRMDADGGNQRQMSFDTYLNTWFPHISPDGQRVVMLSYRKEDLQPYEHLPHKEVELRLMNADGSGMKSLLRLFGGQGTINVNSWCPLSKSFAFVRYEILE